MLKNVVAMSRDRAEKIKPATWSKRPVAVISISSRSSQFAQLSSSFAKILRTNFAFVDGAWRKEGDGGPTPEQIQEILKFIKDLVDDKEVEYDLIVHCGEGRYRSVAVAAFIYHHFDGVEATAAEPGVSMGGYSVSLMRDLVLGYDE
jgi:predicted protein tyrosine phosphatase